MEEAGSSGCWQSSPGDVHQLHAGHPIPKGTAQLPTCVAAELCGMLAALGVRPLVQLLAGQLFGLELLYLDGWLALLWYYSTGLAARRWLTGRYGA